MNWQFLEKVCGHIDADAKANLVDPKTRCPSLVAINMKLQLTASTGGRLVPEMVQIEKQIIDITNILDWNQ